MRTFIVSVFVFSTIGMTGCSGGDDKPKLYGLRCEVNEDCESVLCEASFCSKKCANDSECPPTDDAYFVCKDDICKFKQPRPKPDAPLPYGLPCVQETDCESKLCIDGFCSRTCGRQDQCPPASGKYFFCGQATEDTVACYPKQHTDVPYTTGHDCSVDGKCAVGWDCMGVSGSVNRYCSPECKTDKDCPPKQRCAEITLGYTEPEKKMRCMTRQFGHPCVTDDQCGGPDDLCITDTKGTKYCSKACSSTAAGTCPPFAECKDAGNNKLQCKHKAGYAYTTGGKLCEPCIVHYRYLVGSSSITVYEKGGCVDDGICFKLSDYTNESVCLTPCDKTQPEVKDWCSSDFACLKSPEMCVPITEDPQLGTILGTCRP